MCCKIIWPKWVTILAQAWLGYPCIGENPTRHNPDHAAGQDLRMRARTKLSQVVRTLLVSKQIPWRVMAKMGEDGYVTMEDLAGRWDTAGNARANSPLDHGVTADEGKFMAMRMYQCVRHAKAMVSTGTGLTPGTSSP